MREYYFTLHCSRRGLLTWHAPWCADPHCENRWAGWTFECHFYGGGDFYASGLGFELTVLRQPAREPL